MKKKKAKDTKPVKTMRREFPVDDELDMHGMAVDEALAAADQIFNRYKGKPGILLRFIHGHSNKGPDSIRTRLRLALDTEWKRRVKRIRMDFFNSGATLVETTGIG